MIKKFCDKCGKEGYSPDIFNFTVSLERGAPIIEKQLCRSCLKTIGMLHPPLIVGEDNKQKFFDLMYEVLHKEYGLE